jgi:hypothetical protein
MKHTYHESTGTINTALKPGDIVKVISSHSEVWCAREAGGIFSIPSGDLAVFLNYIEPKSKKKCIIFNASLCGKEWLAGFMMMRFLMNDESR